MTFEDTTDIVEEKTNKMNWLIGVLVLFLLLAATAVAYKMLAAPETGLADVEVMGMGSSAMSASGGATSAMIDIKPAPEIPNRQADETGLFLGRTDDLITIGTGDLMLSISQESDGVPEFSYNGIERDIVVTNQTKLYQDVTEFDINATSIQQTMQALENLDGLGDSATVQVWGRREGERIIADTIVVSIPVLNAIP